jgi:uncharacterized membrane protein YfcA
MHDYWLYLITIVGGLAAGCINTLAGNGSAITLTILTEFVGLPPTVANASNRVGVVSQTAFGLLAFARQGQFKVSGTKIFIWITFLGGLLGVYLATVISDTEFKDFFKAMMVVMLFILLFKPERWIKQTKEIRKIHPAISYPLYFATGVYGGFIQMGVGIFFLVLTVMIARFPVIQANVAKLLVSLMFTGASLILFQYHGLLNWKFGLLLALGQGVGGWLTAHYASNSPKAGLWGYRLLIVGILLSLIKLFELHTYLM